MDINVEKSMEQTILETAENLFLEKGFSAVSTTQIARKVGCNQALVHYYFRTKENLFNTIFEQKFNAFFNSIFEVRNTKELSFTQKLRFIIESHFEILQKNPRIPSLVITELTRRPEQITILRNRLHIIPEKLFAELNAELISEIEKGNIREITLMDLIFSMMSLNLSLFLLMPVVETVLEMDETQKQFMITMRKKQIVDFVLNSIIINK